MAGVKRASQKAEEKMKFFEMSDEAAFRVLREQAAARKHGKVLALVLRPAVENKNLPCLKTAKTTKPLADRKKSAELL
jgi:hypothetical protein